MRRSLACLIYIYTVYINKKEWFFMGLISEERQREIENRMPNGCRSFFKKINKSILVLLVLLGVMLIGTPALAIDTDGDGVDNSVDIDSDNDGILDAIEFQGKTPCPHGFFEVIDGQ
jgi:hypothetical protein